MAVSWVLKPQHRSRVMFQRFMPWWNAQKRKEIAEKKQKEAEEKLRLEEERKKAETATMNESVDLKVKADVNDVGSTENVDILNSSDDDGNKIISKEICANETDVNSPIILKCAEMQSIEPRETNLDDNNSLGNHRRCTQEEEIYSDFNKVSDIGTDSDSKFNTILLNVNSKTIEIKKNKSHITNSDTDLGPKSNLEFINSNKIDKNIKSRDTEIAKNEIEIDEIENNLGSTSNLKPLFSNKINNRVTEIANNEVEIETIDTDLVSKSNLKPLCNNKINKNINRDTNIVNNKSQDSLYTDPVSKSSLEPIININIDSRDTKMTNNKELKNLCNNLKIVDTEEADLKFKNENFPKNMRVDCKNVLYS